MSPDQRIAHIAERQFGLVTTQQLRDACLSDRAICHRVKVGRLVRELRGVYRVPGSRHQRERTFLAAHLAVPGSVLSHRSAAWVWSMNGISPVRPELTLPPHRTSAMGGAIIYRRALAPEDHIAKGPFRLTVPSRTAYDLASVVSEEALEFAIDDAVARRLFALTDLQARLETARRGVPGVARLRRIVDDRTSNGTPGSHLETRAVRALQKAKLPRPLSQFEIFGPNGDLLGRVDLAFPDLMLAIELDGDTYHSTKRQRRNDRVRQNRLAAAGWTVLRFGDHEVRSGGFTSSLWTYLRDP